LATCKWNGSDAGFSLAETVVATAIMAASVAALGQLFAVSVASNRGAKYTTFAATLAVQKMEQLRSLTYGFDALALPVTDTSTNTAVDPASPTGGTGLSASPTGSLTTNTQGYCDFVDQYGRQIGSGGTSMPTGTVYIRRWSIEPLPTNPNNTVLIQVVVTRFRNQSQTQLQTGRSPDEARLVSVKTRKAQ
jgi:type II secretory pathway pseudopilin PulG